MNERWYLSHLRFLWYMTEKHSITCRWRQWIYIIHKQGVLCKIGYPSETDLKPKSHEKTPISIIWSTWNFAQCMAVSLPCSVQNSKTIWQLRLMSWTNEISRFFGLRRISSGYPWLHSTPIYLNRVLIILNGIFFSRVCLLFCFSVQHSGREGAVPNSPVGDHF